MDFDTISNFSSSSNQSDELRSNASTSTLSDLSIYQDEFAQLRHLVDPTKYPTVPFQRCSTPKQDSGCELPYNDRILDLSDQLQNALSLNEKYKNDLFNLEKIVELKYCEKIEKLLRNNNRLKSELDRANDQIERLIRNFSSKTVTSSMLDKNFIQLEQKCHDLSVQNSSLQYELLESRNQKEEYELHNKQLKIECSELKIDNEARNVCIKDLKNKISQQYVEIQTLLKNNLMSSQSIKEISSDLEHLKKAQSWYKDQLHLCQNDKKLLSNEILKCKTDLSSQKERTEMLNVELAKWKHKCDIIQLEMLKEKERLCKKLENINFINGSSKQPESNFIENNVNKSIIDHYEISIQDLSNEITKIKEYVQEQDKTYKKITKENSGLIAHCIILQKNIQQNEMSIEDLENSKKYLNMELTLIKDRVKEKSEELTSSKKHIFSLEAELTVRNQERELVENTITTIRDQFMHVKSKYETLKEEILDKNRQILQLQNEKQKLFMNNNWNICELEKTKEKDTVIDKLKFELASYEQRINKHICEIRRLENELNEKEDIHKSLLEEKQSIVDRHSTEIQKYEDALVQYKIMVTNYENQVNDLQRFLKEHNSTATDLKDNIKILKEEVNIRDLNLSEMQNKYSVLETNLRLMIEEKDAKLKIKNMNMGESLNESDYQLLVALDRFIDSYKIDSDNKKYNVKTRDSTVMLEKINTYLKDNFIGKTVKDTENDKNQLKITVHRLRNEVSSKLVKLEDRIKILYKKQEDCHKMLNLFKNNREDMHLNEKIRELNVLLQVKELEIKEKQKKYEINNRTLLRKVKEHMKGRNHAEKHNKYLQELYNSLSDENNTLKLAISSKDYELEKIKTLLDNYTSINDKLKQSILKLEQKANRNATCDRCLEYTTALKRLDLLEVHIKELENEKLDMQNVLMGKEEIIFELQKEVMYNLISEYVKYRRKTTDEQPLLIQELLLKNSTLSSDKSKCLQEIEEILSDKRNLTDKIETLESELRIKEKQIDELNIIMRKENVRYLEVNSENNQLKKHLNELNDKMEYLSNEIKILNSTLQSKSEELSELEEKKTKMESNFERKDQNCQNIISTLKNNLQEMQVEIISVNSEKYFLQRLCNDLKLALETHAKHNKVLKEQLSNLPKEKQDFNSLPNILPDIPSTCKYDDAYINQLLQQNRAPIQDKPLIEIKGCLDTLRREISTLQEQIAKKNTHFA